MDDTEPPHTVTFASSLTKPGNHTRRPLIIAHRGASASAPENTLAALSTAVELNADAVEIDIHMTADGELVAIHDDTLDRTTDSTGNVRDLTLSQVKHLDAGSWFYQQGIQILWDRHQLSVPTLREALDVVRGRTALLVELKRPGLYPGIEERLLSTLRDYGMISADGRCESVIVQSFDSGSLRRLASLAPGITRCQLTPPGPTPSGPLLDEIVTYAHGIGPCRTTVTVNLVEAAHARGLFVCPYTVNSPDEMRARIEMGVDGLISDNCVQLKRVIREEFQQVALRKAG